MAMIHKMKIMGIRSYSPEGSVIEFQTPLTIIVGHNGTGKTVSVTTPITLLCTNLFLEIDCNAKLVRLILMLVNAGFRNSHSC